MHAMRQQSMFGVIEADTGFIAGRFDTKDKHGVEFTVTARLSPHDGPKILFTHGSSASPRLSLRRPTKDLEFSPNPVSMYGFAKKPT
jgi:hypothetical protein